MNQDLELMFFFSSMKVIRRIIGLGLMLVLLGTHSITALAIERQDAMKQLAASLEKWTAAKEKCGGNYSYKVHWENKLGFGHDTILVVRNNELAERKFTQWKTENGAPKQTDSWTEQGEKLGSHKKGAAAQTLDQVYESSKKLLEKSQKPIYKLEIGFDKEGLLQKCRYLDTRYPDEPMAFGVVIASIDLTAAK